MTREQIFEAIARILKRIAPEADLATMPPSQNWREQLDIDSMDFLNFVVALNKELRVDIPEMDYAKLATLQSCVDYLEHRLTAAA